ncbi:uncharacterized protein LOC132190944 [Corylus avellana]|uniref:uncharacterized protein LOC132190944 n=1 Tax=Corylus avellana TaxID=13451 RepID=UPI00286D4D19|nr:uncharacterized protein LOC132190944 [Corylus avellana]
MAPCFSFCRSSPASKSIRLVHMNGYVEDFEHPVSVSQATGKPPKHFVCTPAQLLCAGSEPLNPDTQLEAGKIYFLLPFSVLRADVSPLDLVSIVRKLTAVAKARRREQPKSSQTSQYGSSRVFSSPGTSPSRFMEPDGKMMTYGAQRSARPRSWTPILDTIREKSFDRKSKSDLQEKQ